MAVWLEIIAFATFEGCCESFSKRGDCRGVKRWLWGCKMVKKLQKARISDK